MNADGRGLLARLRSKASRFAHPHDLALGAFLLVLALLAGYSLLTATIDARKPEKRFGSSCWEVRTAPGSTEADLFSGDSVLAPVTNPRFVNFVPCP